VEIMSDWKREAFEHDRLSAICGTPCIRQS
jgi:hypothetical protein